ncbi:MAG TPA: M28 family peptidase [Pyrinomonadaceae bacterium]|nr:M28 family peptidase [Pyrinomonadaceae bacterium]
MCAASVPPTALAQRSRRGAARPTAAGAQGRAAVRPEWRAALGRISAESMRGHLSFIASDALEGRATPSRGLDLAAEYIAAQFRRAGLEPAGDAGGYFQTAEWELAGRDSEGFEMRLADGPRSLSVGAAQVSFGVSAGNFNVWPPERELALPDAGLFKVVYGDAAQRAALTREQLAGRVVVTELPDFRLAQGPRRLALAREVNEFMGRMHALGAPLVVSFDRAGTRGDAAPRRLINPEAGAHVSPFGIHPTAPLLVVHGAEGAQFFDSLPAGATAARLTLRARAPARDPVKLRNVAGLLRGSDPKLRDTYVIVSAHYDHVGVRAGCAAGDCIYNGANDDGSGTVAVIELAAALSRLERKPRRSILFLAFFGEEMGLLGSRHYGRRPLVPLAKTVAQVNLEQVGRTDDSEGPQVGTAAVTGFDYSDVGEALRRAAEAAGVRLYKHPTKSDAYFSRSDNQALADLGVPAHTVGVAFDFPDYHGVGDHWEKVDYANMERVVRAVALGLLSLADDPKAPRWDESNPRAAGYAEAWKRLHGQ